MRRLLFLILFLSLLASCSEDNEPAIVKQESAGSGIQPELMEDEQEDETIEWIEFPLEDEQIIINLQAVPILKGYLAAAEYPNEKIKKMDLERIHPELSIYLLEFSCTKELCSYLLLNPSESNKAFLLADMAIFEGMHLSPDEDRMAFEFSRTSFDRSAADLIVMDINNWEKLPLLEKEGDKDVLEYQQILDHVRWIDNDHLRVETADQMQTSSENEDISDPGQASNKRTLKIIKK
ncbi:hypothetical protein ACFOGI_06625 [Virgibacillus xinjiangensis]|uniref:DUF4825 domain-containing protein n=1 Tax=Virgibacillus xinjiangensis TaxID=393090 RepID=A0ABV7CUG0_9BACI